VDDKHDVIIKDLKSEMNDLKVQFNENLKDINLRKENMIKLTKKFETKDKKTSLFFAEKLDELFLKTKKTQ